MFTIQYQNIYFSKNHSKIILFDTQQDAAEFLQNFNGYAIARAMQEGINLFPILDFMNECMIEEWQRPEGENTIRFSEIKKEMNK